MNLTPQESELNALISSKRVIIENFFGRLKKKFSIMSDKYRNEREAYDSFFKICCSLVNFDIKECGNCIRAENGEYYIRLMTQQIFLEKKLHEKLKEDNRKRVKELKAKFRQLRSTKT